MGVYIHVPFCLHKCNYCDFLSFDNNHDAQEKYVAALLREIETAEINHPIDTVYFGGGTPTALPSLLLCKILDAVAKLPLSQGAEITVEANPGTLTREYLTALKKHGVTRISLGVQSTKPHLLNAVNRRQDLIAVWENYHTAQEVGFTNINLDVMFGLPGQTMADWAETLAEIIRLAPQHISAYSLTPAEGTPLWTQLENGEITLLTEETDREMYHYMIRTLARAGYRHYELSNFAKPGFESRHNVDCWQRVPYRGFGLGAHSFCGRTRWHNTEDLQAYIAGDYAQKDVEILTAEDAQAEIMILGLRLLHGIAEEDISRAYKAKIIQLTKKGLLQRKEKRVRLTPRGMDLANQVFGEFV